MRDRLVPIIAALFLLIQGGVHLQQYLVDGFSQVSVIGPLFLANAVVAVSLAALVVARPTPPVVVAGILVSLGTLAGLLLARSVGLFGFTTGVWRPIEVLAVVSEVGAALSLAAVLVRRRAA